MRLRLIGRKEPDMVVEAARSFRVSFCSFPRSILYLFAGLQISRLRISCVMRFIGLPDLSSQWGCWLRHEIWETAQNRGWSVLRGNRKALKKRDREVDGWEILSIYIIRMFFTQNEFSFEDNYSDFKGDFFYCVSFQSFIHHLRKNRNPKIEGNSSVFISCIFQTVWVVHVFLRWIYLTVHSHMVNLDLVKPQSRAPSREIDWHTLTSQNNSVFTSSLVYPGTFLYRCLSHKCNCTCLAWDLQSEYTHCSCSECYTVCWSFISWRPQWHAYEKCCTERDLKACI